MKALLKVRHICEHHIRIEWFNNVKDKEKMKEFFAVCHDAMFWKFVQASYTYVFARCESCRRWGLTCKCQKCMDKRAAAAGPINIPCFWNSRKLDQAWPTLEEEKDQLREIGRNLSAADTEGDDDIFQCIVAMLGKMITTIDQFFGYLSNLPWAFATADTVAGAARCVDLFRAKPMDHHDPLTVRIWQRLGGDIEARANGGAMTPDLEEELEVWKKHMPLEESLGEGYHRETHLEKERAAASSDRHIKQSVRFKRTLASANGFVEKYGATGIAVFRFEWRRYKRLLQTRRERQWFPVRNMTNRRVAERVYREDEKAMEDFSSICTREQPVDPLQWGFRER